LRSPKNTKLSQVDPAGIDRRKMLLPGEVSQVHLMDREKSAEVIVVAGYEPLQINGGLTATMKD
jgi:hypothetical protein